MENAKPENKLTLKLLAVIFGVVAVVQTIIPTPSDTAGRVYIRQPTNTVGWFTVAVLAIQALVLLFTVLIWSKKLKNNITIGILVMIFLSIISGALLIADCVTNKEAK